MKIENINQITDELLKQVTASSISDFIQEELKKASEVFVAEKNEKDNAIKAAQEKYESLSTESGKVKEELEKLKAILAQLEEEKAAKIKEEAFNVRMASLDEEYDLTDEDRQVINHHIEVTITMLEKLPWPKHLRNVPEYAGGHHERMDGKGYPRGLTRDQMSVQARCMAIADIFEALTASDRPYKKGKMLSESLAILGKMKLGSHIDPDLFDVFIWERVYEKYARQFLPKEQIDEVDVAKIPGYNPPPIKEKLAS
jgi:HD-GYP domain-containing protein (c-di-GMP phosphodiesterase class II)